MFEFLGAGVFLALIWSAIGYAVAKVKHDEVFDHKKFLKTLLIGLILGLASGYTGYPVTELENMPLYEALLIFIDKAVGLLEKSSKAST